MELRELIIKANEAYYRDNNPTMPDYDYDQLIMRLRGECPDDPLLNRIGDDRKNGAKVRHPFPLLSLDNVYEKEGDDQMALELKLLQRFSSEPLLVVEPKVDGLTLMLCYEKGKLVSAATRGNGLEGEDVLETVRKYVNGIPGEISEEITVFIRGEVLSRWMKTFRKATPATAMPLPACCERKGPTPTRTCFPSWPMTAGIATRMAGLIR